MHDGSLAMTNLYWTAAANGILGETIMSVGVHVL